MLDKKLSSKCVRLGNDHSHYQFCFCLEIWECLSEWSLLRVLHEVVVQILGLVQTHKGFYFQHFLLMWLSTGSQFLVVRISSYISLGNCMMTEQLRKMPERLLYIDSKVLQISFQILLSSAYTVQFLLAQVSKEKIRIINNRDSSRHHSGISLWEEKCLES